MARAFLGSVKRLYLPVERLMQSRAGHASPSLARQSVPLFPLITRGDPPCGDDVRPLPALTAQCRGPAVRAKWTGHAALAKDHPKGGEASSLQQFATARKDWNLSSEERFALD